MFSLESYVADRAAAELGSPSLGSRELGTVAAVGVGDSIWLGNDSDGVADAAARAIGSRALGATSTEAGDGTAGVGDAVATVRDSGVGPPLGDGTLSTSDDEEHARETTATATGSPAPKNGICMVRNVISLI